MFYLLLGHNTKAYWECVGNGYECLWSIWKYRLTGCFISFFYGISSTYLCVACTKWFQYRKNEPLQISATIIFIVIIRKRKSELKVYYCFAIVRNNESALLKMIDGHGTSYLVLENEFRNYSITTAAWACQPLFSNPCFMRHLATPSGPVFTSRVEDPHLGYRWAMGNRNSSKWVVFRNKKYKNMKNKSTLWRATGKKSSPKQWEPPRFGSRQKPPWHNTFDDVCRPKIVCGVCAHRLVVIK